MKELTRSTLVTIVASSLTLLAFYAINAQAQSAWTPAPANAPSGNVAGPLTTGATGQSKAGNLMLNTDGTLANGLIVANGNVGIGTLTPNTTKGTSGYLDAKDVYLRDAGKWASEVGGGGSSGAAKVWANFEGTNCSGANGCIIRAQYGVSKILKTGSGIYRVYFTTPMPDTNYVTIGVNNGPGCQWSIGGVAADYSNKTVDSVTIRTPNYDACTFNTIDRYDVEFVIFR